MGQFEYAVGLAAMKPEQVDAVSQAFNAGYDKGRLSIYKELEKLADKNGKIVIDIKDMDRLNKNA